VRHEPVERGVDRLVALLGLVLQRPCSDAQTSEIRVELCARSRALCRVLRADALGP